MPTRAGAHGFLKEHFRTLALILLVAAAASARAATLDEALDAPGLTWTSGGNAAWIGQTTTTHDGVDAAQSGVINHDQETWMETTVAGPGTLTFWWSVSSESGFDYLEFRTNGVLVARIAGSLDWASLTNRIPPGLQTLRWRYLKDSSVSSGQDRGWVDQVGFVPDDSSLLVQPVDGFVSAGFKGGPFNPFSKLYTLSNASPSNLNWTVTGDQGWVSVDPPAGSLGAGASTNVTLQINASAQSLDYGRHTATVTFSNQTSALAQSRMVRLAVNVPPATRYVNQANPAPAFPYDNWANAATNIQDAIEVAVAGDEILVTNGVYQTGATAVYGMSNRVAVTKPVTVQSVNGPEVTIIAGYRVPGTTNGTEAVRCVYLTNGAVLAGFTLTNGATQTAGGYKNQFGGGAWCESTNALVTNCVLAGNSADSSGGGAYRGTLNDCTLTGNSANSGGGAYYSTLNHCTLTGNWAQEGGGACSSTLNQCTLRGNSAQEGGGGASSGTLNRCTLADNSAGTGGGAYRSTLNQCTLTGNSANYGGGAYYSTLNHCTLTGNSATGSYGGGGGTYMGTLNHCTLTGNSANRGGGTYSGTLTNCAVTGNSANEGGGAYGGTLNNCILTGNSANDGGGAYNGTLNNCIGYYNTAWITGNNYSGGTLNYSCTTPLPSGGMGNIHAEPQLAGNWHLSADSPCRGAGSAAYVSGLDLDGEPWANPPSIGCDEYWTGSVTGALSAALVAAYTNVAVGFAVDFQALIDGRVSASRWDFGDGLVVSNRPWASHAWGAAGQYVVELRAYNESHPAGVAATVTVWVVDEVHYVALSSPNPAPPYSSWATAATNIQDAVDVTLPGALVLVSDGVYETGATAVDGMSNRVAVTNPVTVQSVNGPDVTIIAGYPVPGTTNGVEAVRCVYLTHGAVLAGFTLTNGATQTSGDYSRNRSGGGVWCESVSAVVTNCVLAGNSADSSGGGAWNGTLKNCTLAGNSATGTYGSGGGAYYSTLNHCTLTGNSAYYYGGGARSSTLNHCTLTGNSANYGGGARSSTLNHCTLTGNSAEIYGGGASSGTLNHCTLTDNSAGTGGGAYRGTLNQCMLTGNSADFYGGGTYSPEFQVKNTHYSSLIELRR